MPRLFDAKTEIFRGKLKNILAKKRLNVLLFTENDFIIPSGFYDDFDNSDYNITASSDFSLLSDDKFDFDIVLLCGHLQNEEMFSWRLQDLPSQPFVALWTWDNHHESIFNMRAAMIADAVFPAHWFAHRDIANAATLIAPHLPLCITQWSHTFLASMEEKIIVTERCDRLYGGFFIHSGAKERQRLIESYKAEYPKEHVFVLGLDKRSEYFSHSPEERLQDWASHKVSLNLTLNDDISQRLFDALACGLIPVVPPDLPDLDLVVSQEDQQSLPILRMHSHSVEAIAEAHARALTHFDRDGKQGIIRRHRFARDHHGLRNRIDRLVSLFRPGTSISKIQVELKRGVHIYVT